MIAVDDVIAHMRRVLASERELRDLNLLWQMIEASAAISCPREVQSILPTLTATRTNFDALRARLVDGLAHENLGKLGTELTAKARCTIDLLVRNLFERTADVGFLATDYEVRRFAAASGDARGALHAAMVARLAEYRAKYTVYDDILITATDGRVLARLDDSRACERSSEPLIARALQAPAFVETFAPSDLACDAGPALLYAHRIDDAANGRMLGVLLLRFRFEDEMAGIFADLAEGGTEANRTLLLLLDADGRAIATSDSTHMPIGGRPTRTADGTLALTEYAGREYVTVTCATRGYQGYMGQGWHGHAMIPLGIAFRAAGGAATDRDAPAIEAAGELASIEGEADAINRNLGRVVWNGRIKAGANHGTGGDSDRLKAVLAQVHAAGARTRRQVAATIGDLARTSIGGALRQSRELARLAGDIMDRNLYERANDCRWWALSPDIARLLRAPADADNARELNALLDHVNGLYTVYTKLVVFDADGVIRGASREGAHAWVGRAIDGGIRAAVARLVQSQQYAVTPFEPTDLYDGRPTYVYGAAIRDGAAWLGGVAIVFNSAVEFPAMLADIVAGNEGAVAAFVDAAGKVVAATDERWPAGDAFPFAAGAGDAPDAAVVEHDGIAYACACVRASGYREFKGADRYDNGVRAVVALRLGRAAAARAADEQATPERIGYVGQSRTVELAAFAVGRALFALRAETIVEAVAPRGLARVPAADPAVLGLLEVAGLDGKRVVVPVIDGHAVLGDGRSASVEHGAVIVVQPAGGARPALGLFVDDLRWVAEFDRRDIQAPPDGLAAHAPLVEGLLRIDDDGRLLQIVADERLIARYAPRTAGASRADGVPEPAPESVVAA